MQKSFACRCTRYGKAASFQIICTYLVLTSLLIPFLSACSPSKKASIIQPAINTQPEISTQNSIVIVQPTDPPIPATGPEPTLFQAATQKSVDEYPSCDQVSIGQTTTCMIERSYCSYKKSIKGSPSFCNDAPYPTNLFTFLAWGEDLSGYNGKCLIITGEVKLYQGKPEIIGTESSISICD